MEEFAPDYETTTCSECGQECLDPDSGVGIRRGDKPICGDCADSDFDDADEEEDQRGAMTRWVDDKINKVFPCWGPHPKG